MNFNHKTTVFVRKLRPLQRMTPEQDESCVDLRTASASQETSVVDLEIPSNGGMMGYNISSIFFNYMVTG